MKNATKIMKKYYFTVKENSKRWEALPQLCIECRDWNSAEEKAFELSEKYNKEIRMSESKGYGCRGFYFEGHKRLAVQEENDIIFNQLLPNYLFLTCLAKKTSKEIFMKNLREWCSMNNEKNFQFYQACQRKDFSYIEYDGIKFTVVTREGSND